MRYGADWSASSAPGAKRSLCGPGRMRSVARPSGTLPQGGRRTRLCGRIGPLAGRTTRQTIAGRERSPAKASHRARQMSRAAAEHWGRIDAAGDGDVRARAAQPASEPQRCAGRNHEPPAAIDRLVDRSRCRIPRPPQPRSAHRRTAVRDRRASPPAPRRRRRCPPSRSRPDARPGPSARPQTRRAPESPIGLDPERWSEGPASPRALPPQPPSCASRSNPRDRSASNLTASPAFMRNGFARDRSNGRSGVRPMICQPPGVSDG